MVYELKADRQKSYYGKATIVELSNVKYLKSYDTIVCYLVNNTLYWSWDSYSKTTMNHINDFLKTYGIETLSKKEWESVPYKQITLKQYNAIQNHMWES